MAPRTAPAAKAQTAEAKASAIVGGLTEEQRDALLAELTANPTASAAAERKLSPREIVTASLIRDRDHLDGCPAHDDPKLGAIRAEAYTDTRPAVPAKGKPAEPVAVIRCLECAGTRYIVGQTVESVLAEALAAPSDEPLDDEL